MSVPLPNKSQGRDGDTLLIPRSTGALHPDELEKPMPLTDSPLARKLAAFVSLSSDDLVTLSDLHRRRRRFTAGRSIIRQGEVAQSAFILAQGWAFSYKVLPSGGRQIVDFKIPGDFLGLNSILFRTADHNEEPITQIEASEFLQTDLFETFAKAPRLATAMLWAISRDEAMVVEHLVGMGRRTAAQRTAHLLLELGARLRLVGLADDSGYGCPLSQYLLADALGLSAVHVNRVLRDIREEGLLTFQHGKVSFDDLKGLADFAGFDLGYLDHEGPLQP